jgi:4'-phosphopantetheinyl transferase
MSGELVFGNEKQMSRRTVGRSSSKEFTLDENEIHIWQIDLAGQESEIHFCRRLLATDEVQRAERFYFEEHRRRFIVARGTVRQILGRYTRLAPEHIAFEYGAKGKPELSGRATEASITFNLSHSFESALVAVARGATVGIDIELINPEYATEQIAERFFSRGEADTLRTLPAVARVEGFFSCWTRKEAYIKALGEGLSVPLDSFEVAFGPGVPAALRHVTGDPEEISRWSMYDIEVGEHYKAALVAAGKGHRFCHRQWVAETGGFEAQSRQATAQACSANHL